MRLLMIATAALAGAACDADRTYYYNSTTTTRFVDAVATTTLDVEAYWAAPGSSHGDNLGGDNLDAELRAGPSPGETIALTRTSAHYGATVAGAFAAYQYVIDGDTYVHVGPAPFTAAVTLTSPTSLVTWDPPVRSDERVHVLVTAQSGQPALLSCPPGGTTLATLADRFEIPPCALSEAGAYRVAVLRIVDTGPDPRDVDYLYTWARLTIERELILDVP